MNKFLIALDLDDTLFNKNKKVSLQNRLCIRKLVKKGHIVTIASGRPPHTAKELYDKLKLNGPLICFNGAYIFHPYDKTFTPKEVTFRKEEILDIYNKTKHLLNNVVLENLDESWVGHKTENQKKFLWITSTNLHEGDLNETLNTDTLTMLLEGKEDLDRAFLNDVLQNHPNFSIRYWPNTHIGELYLKNNDKGTALKYLTEYLGIDKEHVIAFGDAENDINLLKNAHYSFAMKNGQEITKKNAKFITKYDNNHSGVAKALRYFFRTTVKNEKKS